MRLRNTLILLTSFLFLACQPKGDEVHFSRFEQLLFSTPVDRLQAELKAHQAEFNTELIMMYPDEPEYIMMAQDFSSDPTMRDIYHITDSLYHDLSDVERQLGRALERARKLNPAMGLYGRFFTMVTGDYDNYAFRVYSNTKDLCVSIDQYALGAMGKYNYFGLPQHIVRLCSKEYIVPDCIGLLAQLNIAWSDDEKTLLDYAIADGKKLYFMEKTLPDADDTLLLRYTKEQLEWMQHNTEQVWSYLIQNRLLYCTDKTLYQNMLDDAPKTNAFGVGSAPRTASYIGWQIVRSYIKKSGATMQELFEETDSQKILNTSGWRP